MWGADDPDTRKPMVWADLTYEDETAHPFGRSRAPDSVAPDSALLGVYQELIALRKRHLRLLVDGALNYLLIDDADGLLAYERALGDEQAVVAFNVSGRRQTVTLQVEDGIYRVVFPASQTIEVTNGSLAAELPPRASVIWIRE
jgi:glycosidase